MPRPRNENRGAIRDQRVSLALTLADFQGLKSLAMIHGQTVNDFLAGVISRLIGKNATVIADFDIAQSKAKSAVDISVD